MPGCWLRSTSFFRAQENTRLQSKVVRLNLGAPQNSAGDNALVEELREENAELREDNDKLVAYLESLERKKKDLEEFAAQAQGGGAPLGQHSCKQPRQ